MHLTIIWCLKMSVIMPRSSKPIFFFCNLILANIQIFLFGFQQEILDRPLPSHWTPSMQVKKILRSEPICVGIQIMHTWYLSRMKKLTVYISFKQGYNNSASTPIPFLYQHAAGYMPLYMWPNQVVIYITFAYYITFLSLSDKGTHFSQEMRSQLVMKGSIYVLGQLIIRKIIVFVLQQFCTRNCMMAVMHRKHLLAAIYISQYVV